MIYWLGFGLIFPQKFQEKFSFLEGRGSGQVPEFAIFASFFQSNLQANSFFKNDVQGPVQSATQGQGL